MLPRRPSRKHRHVGYLDPEQTFLRARHRLNGDLFGLSPGAATLNNIFRAYGHDDGYLYDWAELAEVVRGAIGCEPERAAFRASARVPAVAAAFDAIWRAHESLYMDIVCV